MNSTEGISGECRVAISHNIVLPLGEFDNIALPFGEFDTIALPFGEFGNILEPFGKLQHIDWIFL